MPDPISKSSGGPRVERLQRAVKKNLTARHFTDWSRAIIVDGDPGQLTFKMARLDASMRGLSRAELKKIGRGRISHRTEQLLLGELKRTRQMRKREKERAPTFKKIRVAMEHPVEGDGIVQFDGKPCAEAIAYWLQKARDTGRWHGELVSGVRTQHHSEELCFGICGEPTCPGLCAGTTSNHCCPPSFKCKKGEGAADCTEYVQLGIVLHEIGAPIFNDLPSDRVHFSFSGH